MVDVIMLFGQFQRPLVALRALRHHSIVKAEGDFHISFQRPLVALRALRQFLATLLSFISL